MRGRHAVIAGLAGLLIATSTAGAQSLPGLLPGLPSTSPPGSALGCGPSTYGTGGTPRPRVVNDPLRPAQWALDELRVDDAWATGGRGGGAVVAVVDTGVDLHHPDLAGRLLPGIDLWERRPGGAPDCPGPQDQSFHGTMVAGAIAATADNGIGIAGVAPAAKVLPVRVRDTVDRTDFSQVAAGIRWAIEHGADVIAVTGGVIVPVRPAPLLQEDVDAAVAEAWRRGVVVVATAGNNRAPWCQWPASSPHMVCAAANARGGALAGYSQLPLRLDAGLALRAPGGSRAGGCDHADDIVSATPPGSVVDGCGIPGYAFDSGTTYATAHTAGVAALLASRGLDGPAIVGCLRAASRGGAVEPVTRVGTLDAALAATCAQARR